MIYENGTISGIIDWVGNFHTYVETEHQVNAGIHNKPFLQRWIWIIKDGYLQKRAKRKIRQVVRRVHPLQR
jgi:hypothetical protein